MSKNRKFFSVATELIILVLLGAALPLVSKRCHQLHARDVRGRAAFCFCPLEDKIVHKLCFTSIFMVQTVFTPIL